MATTRKFGIITSTTGITGGLVINSIDTSESVTSAEALNEQGAVTDIAGYQQRRTINLRGYYDTAKGDLAEAGGIITIGGKDYLIESVQQTESNTSFVQVALTCVGADDAEIYIIGGSTSTL